MCERKKKIPDPLCRVLSQQGLNPVNNTRIWMSGLGLTVGAFIDRADMLTEYNSWLSLERLQLMP